MNLYYSAGNLCQVNYAFLRKVPCPPNILSFTLKFQMLENGYYEMQDVEVVIFTKTNATSSFATDFQVSPADLAKLRDGTWMGLIEVQVDLASESPLRVILASETEHTLYDDNAPEGKLELAFSGDEVASSNRLVIQSPGVYEIDDVKVTLVKR